MTIETSAVFINELNENYPRREDLIKEGDDHLRLIKQTLKTTFPNINSEVTISSNELNLLKNTISINNEVLELSDNLKLNLNGSFDLNGSSTINAGSPTNDSGLVSVTYFKTQLMGLVYPVGCVYITTIATDPNTTLGIGTWSQFGSGRVLIGAGTGIDSRSESKNFTNGSEGGEYNHELIGGEIPSHSHSFSGTSSSNGNHSHTISNLGGNGENERQQKPSASDEGNTGWNYVTSSAGNHNHSYSGTTSPSGNNMAHNNIQPYVVVHMWKRIS